jgi:cytochrome c
MRARLAVLLVFLAALGAWFALIKHGGSNRIRSVDAAVAVTQGGNVGAGRAKIATIGCGSCHEIPGVEQAHGKIGPSLKGFKDRATIGGVLANSAPNLVRWLQDPPAVDPQTLMPDLELSEQDARDIAAYLYSPID